MRASAEDSEFENALDSFEAEDPETETSTRLEQYTLEHNLAAARPTVEWTTPTALPAAFLDDLTDEIAADEQAISEALDSFYAEADVARGAREARAVRELRELRETRATLIADDRPLQRDRPQTIAPPRQTRRSGSPASSRASSVIAIAAVCGSLAGAIVIGMMVLSGSPPGGATVDRSAAVAPAPTARTEVADSRLAAVTPAAVPSSSEPLKPPAGSLEQPATPPTRVPATADRPANSPPAPARTTPRQRETAPPTTAGTSARTETPPESKPAAPVAPKSNLPAPGPSRTVTPTVGPGSSSREVAAAAGPSLSPAPPASSAPPATGGGLPPVSRDPAVQPTPAVSAPAPAASTASPEATVVTSPPPARAPEPRPAGAPDPAAVNSSVAAAPAPASSAPASISPPAPAPAAATTPRPAPAEAAANAIASEESAVRTVLNRYRTAYNALNAGAAKAVWPSVDEKALGRAFDRLESQEFDFSGCQIAVTGARATAACNGNARFVPKVGNKSGRQEPRHWTFEMRKANQQWTIDKVNVQ